MIKYLNVILICLSFFIVSCEKNPINNQNHKDDEQILFIRNIGSEYSQICILKPDGSDLDIISQTEFGYNNIGYQEARWSPDKSKIVIVGGPQSSLDIWPLWLIDIDGNSAQNLCANGVSPIWRNSNEIIYKKPRGYTIDTQKDLYKINIEGNKEFLIFESSDTLSISFTDINKAGDTAFGYLWRISQNSLLAKFTIDDISNYTILSYEDTYLGIKPKLSPDEKKIIFAQGIYQNNNLYSLDIMTNTIVNRTGNLGEYHSLAWSPDGQKIAFSKENSSLSGEFKYTCDIFIFDLTADTCINLTGSYSDSISCHVMDWK